MKNYEVQNKAGKASIKLIGSISWWNNNSADFVRQVDDLITAGCTEVECYINTPGGDMMEANEIGNQIGRFLGAKTCKLGALCASSGTLISTYFDTIEASSNTQYMIHDPTVQPVIEHLSDFDSHRGLYENLLNDALERYHAKTGIAIPELTTMLKNTTWLNAKQAKEKGFVDTISPDRAEMPTDAATLLAKGKVPTALVNLFQPFNNHLTQKRNMKQIAITLGLAESATEAEIIAAIERQKLATEGATENGIKLLVTMAEKKGLAKDKVEALAKVDFASVLAIVSELPDKGNAPANTSNPAPSRLTDLLAELRTGQNPATPSSPTTFMAFLEKDKKGLLTLLNTDPAKVQKLYEAEFKYMPTVEDLKAVIR